jgi:Arc/MetJ-type ribon-helix-helix transcriptional regulator
MSKNKTINSRVTFQIYRTIHKIIDSGAFNNESDFIREAIRDKIQNDYPDLWNELNGDVE